MDNKDNKILNEKLERETKENNLQDKSLSAKELSEVAGGKLGNVGSILHTAIDIITK